MKRTLFTIILAVLLTSGLSLAQMPPDHPGMGFRKDCDGRGMGMGPRWMDKDDDDEMGFRCMEGLDLTEEQQKEIARLRKDHQRKMLELKSEMDGFHAKMKLMMTDENFDKKGFEKALDKAGEHHKKVALAKADHMQSIRKILTPEQRDIFDSKILHGKGGPGQGGFGKGNCRNHGFGM